MSSRRTLTVAIRGATSGRELSLDVSFEAPPGITILFGPSGSGKSTTLAAISGLIRPAHGRITLGDEVWFDSEQGIDRPVHQRGVAMLFQSLALFPHLTARANVEYGIDRRRSHEERRDRAVAMLERMKVLHLADRRPHSYSGGEARRVALARAFAMTPSVLLLDEPFTAIDRDLQRQLEIEVKSYVDEVQIPVIHVTHHRDEARAMGKRIVSIRAGRVERAEPIALFVD